ncbi:MAG: trigger factor [Patescibacteria group bacterium]
MAKTNSEINYVVARVEGGTIQITFTVPFSLVSKEREESLKEYAKDIEVPGFRKGHAPLEKVKERVPAGSLIEHTLSHILPKALAEAITEEKIRPAIYPKFELIKAEEGEPWEVRAVTCEVPKVELGDYKKIALGAARAKSIWTPGKGEDKEKKEPTKEEKEQEIIKVLLGSVKVEIPKLLIEEEVNARLSNLLARTEKLGLTLEGYLASIGKTSESLRVEYENQAKGAISLDLILSTIAQEEKIVIKETEIDAAIKAASADPQVGERLNTPEQRRIIASVLARRAALDGLTNLL